MASYKALAVLCLLVAASIPAPALAEDTSAPVPVAEETTEDVGIDNLEEWIAKEEAKAIEAGTDSDFALLREFLRAFAVKSEESSEIQAEEEHSDANLPELRATAQTATAVVRVGAKGTCKGKVLLTISGNIGQCAKLSLAPLGFNVQGSGRVVCRNKNPVAAVYITNDKCALSPFAELPVKQGGCTAVTNAFDVFMAATPCK